MDKKVIAETAERIVKAVAEQTGLNEGAARALLGIALQTQERAIVERLVATAQQAGMAIVTNQAA